MPRNDEMTTDKAVLEELELAHGKESLNMYHNGGILTKLEWIEHRINVIKERLERANK
jgi:hypothetical protein